MADLYGVRAEGEQPLGGEGFQYGLGVQFGGGAPAGDGGRARGTSDGVSAVTGSRGEAGEHLPGNGLLSGSQPVVGGQAGLEISPHHQDHQRRRQRRVIVRLGGGRVQRADEGLPLRFVLAEDE